MGGVRPNAKGKWPDQTLERRSDGLECWRPSTPRICVTSSSGNGYNPVCSGLIRGIPAYATTAFYKLFGAQVMC
jgi:hypothetical protein